MKISCPQCSAGYRIADERVPEEGGVVDCPACAHRFVIPAVRELRTQHEPVRAAAPAGAGGGASPPGPVDAPHWASEGNLVPIIGVATIIAVLAIWVFAFGGFR